MEATKVKVHIFTMSNEIVGDVDYTAFLSARLGEFVPVKDACKAQYIKGKMGLIVLEGDPRAPETDGTYFVDRSNITGFLVLKESGSIYQYHNEQTSPIEKPSTQESMRVLNS